MNTNINHFRIALGVAIVWTIVMRLFSPANIVEFEFAGSVQKATEIIELWGDKGVSLAKTSTYLDFVFLIVYSAAISLGCLVASSFSKLQILIKTAKPLSRIVWVAGICDAIENMAMLKTLQEINQTSISIAYYFAAIKFTIVFIGLLFILISYIARIFTKTQVARHK
jgi:hypothetical protein